MSLRARRRALILDLLSAGPIPSQERLAALLAQRGMPATQATLSRDLRDLHVHKGPEGYVPAPPGGQAAGVAEHARAAPAVRGYMLSCQLAASLVVLRTRPGHASALALELDRAALPGCAGSIAGDDTIFLATASPARARALVRMFRAMADHA